jgi:hypothetical protein
MPNSTHLLPGVALRLRVVLALSAAMIAALALASGARAGTFNVNACFSSNPTNNVWSPVDQSGGRLAVYSSCAANYGLVTRNAVGAGNAAFGDKVWWEYNAPGGSSVVSMHAPKWVNGGNSGGHYRSGIVTNSGWTAYCDVDPWAGFCGAPPADGSWFGSQGGALGNWNDWNLTVQPGTTQVQIRTECIGGGGCPRGNVYGVARFSDITLTLANSTAPSLYNGSGNLWTSNSWLEGVQSASFDAADDTGIKAAYIDLDGTAAPAGHVGHSCDSFQAIPCPNGGASTTVNTSNLSDGGHTLRMYALDGADNWADAGTHTFYVDHTAPAPTGPPSLVGGRSSATWYSTNGFNLSFSTPGTGGGSPNQGGAYELCRWNTGTDASTGQCKTVGVNAADGQETITVPGTGSDTELGGDGAYRVRFRVDDALHTGSWGNWSPLLRFDDSDPGAAGPTIRNGWINRLEAEDYLVKKPSGPLPASDIAGYAVAFDSATPGATVTNAANQSNADRPAEVDLTGLSEGVHTIKARTISGSGVASSNVASQTLRVDLTGPTVAASGGPDPNKWVNQPVTVDLTAQDQPGLSGMTAAAPDRPLTDGGYIEYILDGGSPRRVRGDKAAVTVADDGEHVLTYRAVDVAGNPSDNGGQGNRTQSVRFKVDQHGPDGGMLPPDPSNPRLIRFWVTEDCLTSYSIQIRPENGGDWRELPTERDGNTISATVPDDLWNARGNYQVRAVVTDCAGNTTILDRWWEGQQAGQPINLTLPARIKTVLRMALNQDDLATQGCIPTKKTVAVKPKKKATSRKKSPKKPKAHKASIAAVTAKKKPKKKAAKKQAKKIITVYVCPDGRVIDPSKSGKKKAAKKPRKSPKTAKGRAASISVIDVDAYNARRKKPKEPKVKPKTKAGGPPAEQTGVEDQPKRVYGFLATVDGRPIPGAAVDVEMRVKGTDRWVRLSTERTDDGGQLSASIPAGPSRAIRLSYQRTEVLDDSTSAPVDVKVVASSTIKALRSNARNGQTVKFAGKLLGGFIPAGGRELELDGFNPVKRKWMPVKTAGLRAKADGRWTASYRFTATTGRVTYQFRLRIADAPDYPFEEGYSKTVRVAVTGKGVAVKKRTKEPAKAKTQHQ